MSRQPKPAFTAQIIQSKDDFIRLYADFSEEALDLCNQVGHHRSSLSIRLNQAQLYYGNQQWQPALDLYTQALKLNIQTESVQLRVQKRADFTWLEVQGMVAMAHCYRQLKLPSHEVFSLLMALVHRHLVSNDDEHSQVLEECCKRLSFVQCNAQTEVFCNLELLMRVEHRAFEAGAMSELFYDDGCTVQVLLYSHFDLTVTLSDSQQIAVQVVAHGRHNSSVIFANVEPLSHLKVGWNKVVLQCSQSAASGSYCAGQLVVALANAQLSSVLLTPHTPKILMQVRPNCDSLIMYAHGSQGENVIQVVLQTNGQEVAAGALLKIQSKMTKLNCKCIMNVIAADDGPGVELDMVDGQVILAQAVSNRQCIMLSLPVNIDQTVHQYDGLVSMSLQADNIGAHFKDYVNITAPFLITSNLTAGDKSVSLLELIIKSNGPHAVHMLSLKVELPQITMQAIVPFKSQILFAEQQLHLVYKIDLAHNKKSATFLDQNLKVDIGYQIYEDIAYSAVQARLDTLYQDSAYGACMTQCLFSMAMPTFQARQRHLQDLALFGRCRLQAAPHHKQFKLLPDTRDPDYETVRQAMLHIAGYPLYSWKYILKYLRSQQLPVSVQEPEFLKMRDIVNQFFSNNSYLEAGDISSLRKHRLQLEVPLQFPDATVAARWEIGGDQMVVDDFVTVKLIIRSSRPDMRCFITLKIEHQRWLLSGKLKQILQFSDSATTLKFQLMPRQLGKLMLPDILVIAEDPAVKLQVRLEPRHVQVVRHETHKQINNSY